MVDLFKSGYEKRFGCLYIEHIKNGLVESFEGYACEAGGEPYKVQDIKDVSKKVIWWTNIPYTACWSYGRFKTLKPDNYLGIKLSDIIMNMVHYNNIVDELTNFAFIFKRLYYFISESYYNGQNFKLSDGILSDHFLIHDVLNNYDMTQSNDEKNDDKKNNNEISEVDNKNNHISLEALEIAERSYLDVFRVNEFLVKDKEIVQFSIPYVPFLKEIKNINIPKGQWTILDMNLSNSDLIDFLKEYKKPYIIKVNNWHFFNNENVKLMDRNQNQHINRHFKDLCWYTQNEFEMLLNYARPDIEAVYSAENWQKISEFPQYLGELEDYSVSCQLYWYAWWRSLCEPCRHPYTRKKQVTNPVMSWLKAEQRIRLLDYVIQFDKKGYNVESYGDNKINVWVDPDETEIKKVCDEAYAMGLTVPAAFEPETNELLSKINFEPILDDQEKIKQFNYFNSILINEYLWYDLDCLVLPEFENKTQSILKQSSQNLLQLKKKLKQEQKDQYSKLLTQQARKAVEYVKTKKNNQ